MRLTVTLAAAGLVLITAVTFAARLWWAFDLFTHFRMQYVVAAILLGLLALVFRAYRLLCQQVYPVECERCRQIIYKIAGSNFFSLAAGRTLYGTFAKNVCFLCTGW